MTCVLHTVRISNVNNDMFVNRIQEMVSFELSKEIDYSIYKHNAIDIADPSSMQDLCNMNFIIDLVHRSIFVAHW